MAYTNQPTYVTEISRMTTSKILKKKALELKAEVPSYADLGSSDYITSSFENLL